MHENTARGSGSSLDQAACAAVDQGEMDEFIYLISHDVRGCVRALLELPKWIGEDLRDAEITLGADVEGYLDLMERHAGRLDRMLTDLLTYSRVGRMQISQKMDIGRALDRVLAAHPIPLSFTVSRALKCAHVVIGERDLLTLLEALIDNATKHHDCSDGCIQVTTGLDGGDIVLSVSDDGPGIDPSFHDQVFRAMSTLRPRDEVEGSGMGLAQVRKIAEFYGGSATLTKSPFARGISVSIRLPHKG